MVSATALQSAVTAVQSTVTTAQSQVLPAELSPNHSGPPFGEKPMYDPVNRPPDEDPPGGLRLNDRQKAVLDRKHCNALLESIKDERHGLLWWQSTPISYCFSDSIVRDRLLKLMKSETVRLMDRNYMLALSDRLIEANWELVHNRIEVNVELMNVASNKLLNLTIIQML